MVKVTINVREIGQILASDQVRDPLHDIAEKMADRARASAPVASGAYRDGIDVEPDHWQRGAAQYAIERVVAHDGKSSAIESRTGNLKRAMRR